MKRILMLSILTACGAVDDASLLDHARILAVRAEPAHVPAGERARIDVLAGDDAGHVFETDPDTVEAPGVSHDDTGWYVTAALGSAPGAGGVTLSVSLAIDGVSWPATKSILFGERADNPTVDTMQVDGADSSALDATIDSAPVLTAVAAPDLTYAWYSSVGSLDHARSQAATLDAALPATGTIVVVVRDATGGVGWATLPATVR